MTTAPPAAPTDTRRQASRRAAVEVGMTASFRSAGKSRPVATSKAIVPQAAPTRPPMSAPGMPPGPRDPHPNASPAAAPAIAQIPPRTSSGRSSDGDSSL